MNQIAKPVEARAPIAAAAVPPAAFAHFVVKTAQPQKVIDWYRTVLSARIVHRDERLCFMTYDDEHHRLAVLAIPDLKVQEPAAAGVHHVAYTHANLRNLLSNYRRLKAEGIEPVWCVNHGPTVSMYYQDPDGTAVEFQVDAFPTTAQLQGYFQSDDFRANPVGIAYDPEDMIARFDQGVPEVELLRRPPGPPAAMPKQD